MDDLIPWETIVIVICSVIGFGIGLFVGAYFLRASIGFCNLVLRASKKLAVIPEPKTGDAMLIVLGITIANALIGYVGRLAFESSLEHAYRSPLTPTPPLALIPLGILVSAMVLTQSLPTKFSSAISVIFCYIMIWMFILGVVFLIGLSVYR